MNNLPEDIFLEILIKLPVKSLLRFKSVSKSWRSSITNPKFVKRYVASPMNNPSNHLFIAHNKFCSNQLAVVNANSLHKVISLNTPIHASSDDDLRVVGSCNGLLCLAYMPKKLCLWNHATGKVKHIHRYSIKFNQNCDDYRVYLGFGFDHASADYKVVRICLELSRPVHRWDWPVVINKRAEVYSLNKNSWKEIELDLELDVIRSLYPAFVKGSLYWIVLVSISEPISFKRTMLSFNLQKEDFCTISLPGGIGCSDIFEFKESVAISESAGRVGSINIWTLEDDGSWIKKLTINSTLIKVSSDLVGCLNTGVFAGLIFSNELVLYDSVNEVVKPIQPIMHTLRTYNYSESLVDLN